MAKSDLLGEEPLSANNLKAAAWYTVSKIAEDEEPDLGIAVSEQAVAALAEMVFQQAQTLGRDLEAFAQHANRTTIEVDDLKLAARANPSLYTALCTAATSQGLALSELKTKAKPPVPKPKATRVAKKKAEPKGKGKAADKRGRGGGSGSEGGSSGSESEAVGAKKGRKGR